MVFEKKFKNNLSGAVAIVYLMLEILEANTLKEYPRYPGPRPGEFQIPSKFLISFIFYNRISEVFYLTIA